MRKVKVSVRIDRSVEDVFAYVIAVETMPEWRGDVAEAVELKASSALCSGFCAR